MVGNYVHGMIVEVPLSLHSLPGKPGLADLHAVLAEAYDGEHFIEVATQGEASSLRTLAPEDLNGTNRMKLYVFGSEKYGQARLVAAARQSRQRRVRGRRAEHEHHAGT